MAYCQWSPPSADNMCEGELQTAIQDHQLNEVINSFFHLVWEMCDGQAGMLWNTHVKSWCVENDCWNLAFHLAAVTEDWDFIQQMASTKTCCYVHPCVLFQSIQSITDDKGVDCASGCSAAISLLRNYTLDAKTARFFTSCRYHVDQMITACEVHGLLDWALLFSSDLGHLRTVHRNLAFVIKHYKNCANQHVLDQILMSAVDRRKWDLAGDLLPTCTSPRSLRHVLLAAVQQGHVGIAQTLITKVDTSTITCGFEGKKTLLLEALDHGPDGDKDASRSLVRLCISSGLSTFQRRLTDEADISDFLPDGRIPSLQILKLLVESGTCTSQALCLLSDEVQSLLSDDSTEEERDCQMYIKKAASTPCSLLQLARLTISDSIGYQPGRTERIEALPVPNVLKRYLKFEDVLADDDDCQQTKQEQKNNIETQQEDVPVLL